MGVSEVFYNTWMSGTTADDPCQAPTFGNVEALGHRRATYGAAAYAMQSYKRYITDGAT